MATLGQRLRDARLQSGHHLDEIARETCVPAGVLRDLEEDNYARFDSVIYVKSYLGKYSKFLGLDISHILSNLSSRDIADPGGIFKRAHTPLENTEAPKPPRERRMPIMLAPICVGLVCFVSYCLYALATKSALPFQPSASSAPVKTASDGAAAGSVSPGEASIAIASTTVASLTNRPAASPPSVGGDPAATGSGASAANPSAILPAMRDSDRVVSAGSALEALQDEEPVERIPLESLDLPSPVSASIVIDLPVAEVEAYELLP